MITFGSSCPIWSYGGKLSHVNNKNSSGDEIYTVGVARSLCRRLLQDIVIVNGP